MLSRLSVISCAAMTLGLTACGGGVDDTNPINDIVQSSSSVESSSSMSSSSVSSSSSSSSSEDSGPLTISVEEGEGWRVHSPEGQDLSVTYVNGGVQYAPKAVDDQLMNDLAAPINLNGATLSFTFEVSADYMDGGFDVQPIVQDNFEYSNGFFDCYINNADLVAGENTYDCEVPDNSGTDTSWEYTGEGEGIQFGFQAKKGDSASADDPISGTVTITGVTITGPNISGGGGGEPEPEPEPAGDVVVTPSADNIGQFSPDQSVAEVSFNADEEAVQIDPNFTQAEQVTAFYLAGEGELEDLTGASVTYELQIPEYYTSTNPGLQVQFFIQQNAGSYSGEYGGFVELDAFTDEGNGVYSYTQEFASAPADAVRVGMQLARNGDLDGSEDGEPIFLNSIVINYAE